MDKTKFKNLTLRICNEFPDSLTIIKFHKLLWLIDKEAFLTLGETITKMDYMRQWDGPVPFYNFDILREMAETNCLDISIASFENAFNYYVFKALAKSDGNVFSIEEHNIISDILSKYGAQSDKNLVELSQDLSWAVHENMEIMPFETYLVEINYKTEDMKKRRDEIIEEAKKSYRENDIIFN